MCTFVPTVQVKSKRQAFANPVILALQHAYWLVLATPNDEKVPDGNSFVPFSPDEICPATAAAAITVMRYCPPIIQ